MKSALLVFGAALLLSAPGSSVFAANATVPLKPIRGEVIINRTTSAWESQQVQEPCILPNPKDPTRLVMFYSGVPATNRNVCFIGIDGHWDLWCIACDRRIPTLPGGEGIYIPGQPTAAAAGR